MKLYCWRCKEITKVTRLGNNYYCKKCIGKYGMKKARIGK